MKTYSMRGSRNFHQGVQARRKKLTQCFFSPQRILQRVSNENFNLGEGGPTFPGGGGPIANSFGNL